MRTTVELPDELLQQAKSRAALAGVSLREFFIEAIQQKLVAQKTKVRRPPPEIGSVDAAPIGVLTAEQIDEAMFVDVNVILALSDGQHQHHSLASNWLRFDSGKRELASFNWLVRLLGNHRLKGQHAKTASAGCQYRECTG